MNNKIVMGNDEFILYIRKKHYYKKNNSDLGKKIFKWLQEHDKEAKIFGNISCLWGKIPNITGPFGLPETATQFEFERSLLPELYNFLDEISKK